MEFTITGTHIWYYFICPREVWLMSRQITPDEDTDSIVLGRYFDQETYQREKKSLEVENSRIDVFHAENGKLVVGEVKKSSKYRQSAHMQLAFYLHRLREKGLDARGELRFPLEKTREEVRLDEETLAQLKQAMSAITDLVQQEIPPAPKTCPFCKNCGYAEFCWS